MVDWKQELDPILKDYLNSILKEVIKNRDAYSKAKDKKIAQLWIAIALLYREINLLRAEIEEIKQYISEGDERKKVGTTLKKFF